MEEIRPDPDEKEVIEVPLLKNNASLNLEQSVNANRGNPYIGSQMNKNAKKPVKFLMGAYALFIIFALMVILAVTLYFYLSP
ncbi:MAG: hypothetical protein KGH65_05045 [Candidatus Micrarchaeota archaeon]|nr:hypothetical protein [Candidatus Micrarchaeota archaeon]